MIKTLRISRTVNFLAHILVMAFGLWSWGLGTVLAARESGA